MIRKIVIGCSLFVATSFVTQAQETSKAFYKNLVNNPDNAKKTYVALPSVEPSDILYSKVVWREIVLREKMNLPLYYPTEPIDGRMSLIDLLMKGIQNSYKTAYDDDELSVPITFEEIKKRFDAVGDTITIMNNETGQMESVSVAGEIHTDEVKRILLKEIWYFNKRTSRLESRIISICPVREFTKDDFDGIMKRQLFWIDYGEFRDILAKQKVFMGRNSSAPLTFDDIFLKRYFSSRIYQEESMYNNRPISSYAVGIDAILESERIKNEMFNNEQGLWEY
ncbi:MAG: gliding motility protein GldN [Culturomica sp.]|jgi:gliding motility associated protien GldN|nr:gliding motility protein GldN [Culturomica sp.]